MNTQDQILDSIARLGNELMTTGDTVGVRAAAAWFAMNEPDAIYELDDEEAPYRLRAVVGERIGWDAAQAGLDPEGDIPRYVDYMRLRDVLGSNWPFAAMDRHLSCTMDPDDQAQRQNVVIGAWVVAVLRYVDAHAAHEAQQEEEAIEAAD